MTTRQELLDMLEDSADLLDAARAESEAHAYLLDEQDLQPMFDLIREDMGDDFDPVSVAYGVLGAAKVMAATYTPAVAALDELGMREAAVLVHNVSEGLATLYLAIASSIGLTPDASQLDSMLDEEDEKLIDPDCVQGKHYICLGGLCSCECHHNEVSGAAV